MLAKKTPSFSLLLLNSGFVSSCLGSCMSGMDVIMNSGTRICPQPRTAQ
jgi:hypothetical protein